MAIDPEINVATLKMSVGGIFAGVTVITLNEWVAIATITYMTIQILLLMPKLICEIKRFKNYIKKIFKK